MRRDVDVAVVGGGIVGLTCAVGLAAAGRRVVLCEKQAKLAPRANRLFALNHPAVALLREHGAWPGPAGALAVRRMRLHASCGGALEVCASKLGMESLCHTVYEDDLFTCLNARAQSMKNLDISLGSEAQVESVVGEQARLEVAGEKMSARLVVAADSARSSIVKTLDGKLRFTPTTQSAVVAEMRLPGLDNTARQWMGEGEVLALLPGTQSRAGVIWSMPHGKARHVASLAAADFMGKLAARCGDGLLVGSSHARVLGCFEITEHTSNLDCPRVVAVGDSLHGFHPLAGQGLSVGLGDVACLLRLAGGMVDPGCAKLVVGLRRARHLRTQATMLATGLLWRLVDSGTAGSRIIRMGLGLRPTRALANLANIA